MRPLALLIISGSLWLASTAAAQEAEITATAYQTINVRSGPGTEFDIVGQVAQGDTVPVTGRDGQDARWYQVALEDGAVGWVSSFTVMVDGDLELIPVITPDGGDLTDTSVRIVAYGRVNVRSGPGINYEVIGQLDVNEEAPALARNNRNNDWLYIEHESVSGWVAYFTVNVVGDASALPIRVPDGSGEELVPPSTLIRTRYNVRVRQSPDNTSAVVGLVEFDSRVTPVARTENSQWLYIVYDDMEGWALAELFDVPDGLLLTLPVFTPRPGVTPQPTRPAPTPRPED